MSTKEKVVSTDTPTVTETLTPHTASAQSRLQELRAIREQIPHFTIPESKTAAVRMNNVANVPPAFLELTAVAVANHPSLERKDGLSPAEMRDLLRYADAYAPLADELEAFAQFLRFSVNTARFAAGSEALAIYAIAQRLAKLPKTASLAPHVADMRRTLGRARTPSPEVAAKNEAVKAARASEKAAKAAEKAEKTRAKKPAPVVN